MTKTKTNKVWGERMKSKPSKLLTEINASIDIDQELYIQDIQGSIVHCKMLAKQKIISQKFNIYFRLVPVPTGYAFAVVELCSLCCSPVTLWI